MDNDDGFDIFGDLNNLQKKIALPKDRNADATTRTESNAEYDEEYLDDLFASSSNKSKKSSVNHFRKMEQKKDNSKTKSAVAKENKSSISNDQALNVENILSELIQLEETPGPVTRRTRSNRNKRTTTQNGEMGKESSSSAQLNSNENMVSPTISPPKRGRRGRRSAASNNIAVENVTNGQMNMIQVLESMSNINAAARRQLLAEYASRAPQVGFVDLSSCVQPRVEGYVCLDSDEEEKEVAGPNSPTVSSETPLNASFDADNPEISVKIRWNGDIQKFSLRKYQKFSHIIEQIAQREHVPLDEIVLNLKDRFVKPNDTPDSIEYKVYDFIDGRAMKLSRAVNTVGEGSAKIVTNEHKSQMKQFQLKVQSEQMKRPIIINLKKTDTLKILFIKCSEELNLPHSRLKLSFDGEAISPEDTPEQLELEGGEIIDLRIKPL